jgi:flagellar biosynthesis protein FliR
MISLSLELQAMLSGGFWHGAIVFMRVAALVSVLPAFGERTVPTRVKLVLALAFSVIVAPAVPSIPAPESPLDMAQFAVTEAIVGLSLGIAIRLFALALQTAGSIAAQSTSLSQLLGGAAVEPSPAMGFILVVAGLALAVMAGLHVQAAKFLIFSYDLFPAGEFPDGRILSSWAVGRVSYAFSLAFVLAAPFVVASVIYNLAIGVINKAMPQLPVAFVGAPVITFGGLFLLFIAAPLMLSVWSGALSDFFQAPAGRP